MSGKLYSGIDRLPRGEASGEITPGCIVPEGGAFRRDTGAVYYLGYEDGHNAIGDLNRYLQS